MSHPLLGQTISDRYRLKRTLSTGGMGQVFEATDTHLFDRRVAIKILHQNLSGTDLLRRRFHTEARICALLGEHPLIVRVTDYGIHNDQPYIVMEFLGAPPFVGQPLNRILKQGPLTLRRVVRLGRQICSAMQYAHSFSADQPNFRINGVIHRDIKPSNIFVLRDRTMGETTKILDFGIAKTLSDVTMALGTHMGFIGTPAYASPEQIRGEPLDFRADVYSLGVVLYEMLSGDLPLVPKTDSFPGWYEAQNFQAPKPLDQSTIAPAIIDVVMSCLAKERDQRPSSMGELRENLKVALQQSVTYLNKRSKSHAISKSNSPSKRKSSQKPSTLSSSDAQFLKIVRPLEVALVEFNVAPRFKLKGKDLYVLLAYPSTSTLDRSAILKQIANNLLGRNHAIQVEQVVVYGRPFNESRPTWKKALDLTQPDNNVYDFDSEVVDDPVQAQADAVIEASEDVFADLADEEDDLHLLEEVADIEEALIESDEQPILEPEKSDLEDGGDEDILLADQQVTQFGSLQRAIFLASLPPIADRIAQVRQWSQEESDSLLSNLFAIELRKSIVDIEPGAMLSYQDGIAALQECDILNAIKHFSSAIEVDPNFAEAHVYLGQAYARDRNLDQAISELETALSLEPSLAEAYTYLGSIYTKTDRLDDAIQAFQNAVDLNPNLIEGYPVLLRALFQKDEIKATIQSYLDALQQVPQLISMRAQMSQVMLIYARELLEQGEQADATFYLRKAVSYISNDAVLHCYLGLALVSGKDKAEWQEAATHFRIASRLEPKLAEAHLGLGIAYSKTRNYKAAVGAYQDTLKLNSRHPAAHYYLGMAYYKQGDLEAAIQEFQTVIKIDPQYVEASIRYGEALLQSGDLSGSQKAFDTVLRSSETHLADVYCGRGKIFIATERLSSAIASFRQALDISPMLAMAHAGIGLVYLIQKQHMAPSDFEAAKAKFDLALRIDPTIPEAYFGLGEIDLQRERLDYAIKNYRIALQYNQSYTAAHYKLGIALANKGQIEEAITEIRTTLQLNAKFPGAQMYLTELLNQRWS